MPELKPFNATVQSGDPDTGRFIAEHVVPVDSPDAEHAAASIMSNAFSFTTKTRGGVRLPVASRVMKIKPRT